jgi:hypothetical protein
LPVQSSVVVRWRWGVGQGLFEVLRWVRQQGDPSAYIRLRLKLLPLSVREGLVLDEVEPLTACSPDYLDTARKVAGEIVGRPYPQGSSRSAS